MEDFSTVDYEAANQNLEKLKVRGKIKPGQFRRIKKGMANIQKGQAQGFAYDVNKDQGTFTAKNEKGEHARGKIGGKSGFNFIEGRKTSKALSYLSQFENKPEEANRENVHPIKSPDRPKPSVTGVKFTPAPVSIPTVTPQSPFNIPVATPSSATAKRSPKPFMEPSTEVKKKEPVAAPESTAQGMADAYQEKKAKEEGIRKYLNTDPRKEWGLKPDPAVVDDLRKKSEVRSTRENYLENKKTAELERLEKAFQSAKNRGDLGKVRMYAKLIEDLQQNKKEQGGKLPMAENGFKVPVYNPRAKPLQNSFLDRSKSPSFKTNTLPFGSPLNKPANPVSFKTPDFLKKRMSGNVSATPEPDLTGLPDDMLNQDRPARQIDTFGAINTGLGLFGAAKTLTAKPPKMSPTPEYKGIIRPFSGDQEALTAKNNAIDQEAYAATQDLQRNVGSGATSYLTGRTMVQSNVNRARAQAISEDGQIRRMDRDRFDQQKEGENRLNYDNKVRDQRESEAMAYDQYLNRVQTGQGMMQQSLNYANAKNADQKNKEVALKQVEQRMASIKDSAKYNVLYAAISRGGLESLTPDLRAAYNELMGVPAARNGMKISYFKSGGRMNADKILSGANRDIKSIMLRYSDFVAKASRQEMADFQKYMRQINRVSKVNVNKR